MFCESVLEFEELRELLRRYLRSPIGRGELERLEPVADRHVIEEGLADVAEAIEYQRVASQPQTAGRRGSAVRLRFDFDGDPELLIARLRIEGTVLEGRELYEAGRLLDLSAEARSVLLAAADRYPRLGAHASQIHDLREAADALRGKILPDGSLADEASVALARLRRETEKQRKHIEDSLAKFLKAHHGDGTLQEDFVTIRDDRWVVPVVSGRERRVDGVIHGSSGSGQTLFVEPLETIQLNNELVRLREEELRETHRLLREFTAKLRAHAADIGASMRALAVLELLFVKAEFASDFYCVVPRLSADGAERISLKNARHPLLADILRRKRASVTPMSLTLEGQQRTLLISGPNTGGKTVALKTIGLLALMTHAAIPVPADDAEFPLFDQVLADIGDHQSLQESLSSYSSHIVNVRGMLEKATADSLVLLDELGRATDPDEGGALGVAILDAFRRYGAFTAASTHLMAMKTYGSATTGVLNASMGFDDATLQPTYVLRTGAPGKSAGLDIASRLGLEPALIEDARQRMGSNERDAARLLAELHQRIDALDREKDALNKRVLEVDERERSMEQRWERTYAAKIREVEDRAAALGAEFEERARTAIEEMSDKARSQAQAKIARTKREFREAVAEIAPRALSPSQPSRPKLEEGARVRLKGVRQPATVRRILANGGIEVEAGFIKLQVPESDVEEVLAAGSAPQRPSGITLHAGPPLDSFREINLVGQRAAEACEHLDKFLDNAALAQVDRIRVVHGHGMGVLKKAVAELLGGNPHVAKYYVAPPEEGGSGSTIVELK